MTLNGLSKVQGTSWERGWKDGEGGTGWGAVSCVGHDLANASTERLCLSTWDLGKRGRFGTAWEGGQIRRESLNDSEGTTGWGEGDPSAEHTGMRLPENKNPEGWERLSS